MNFSGKNIAATGETVQTVDSGHGTCGGVVQGAIPQQQVVVLAYPMQLAAAKTLHASTEIVNVVKQHAVTTHRISQHIVPHGVRLAEAGLPRAKRQTDLPLLSFLLCLQVSVMPEMLLLRSALPHPKLQHCLTGTLELLTVAHVFALAILQILSVFVKLYLYEGLYRQR